MSILAPLFFGVVAARWGIAAAFRLGALAWIFFAPLEPGAAASRSVGFADRRHARDNTESNRAPDAIVSVTFQTLGYRLDSDKPDQGDGE